MNTTAHRVPYVGLAIALCLLATGLCAFFLFPRDVVITSNRPLLEPLKLQLNYSASFVNITVVVSLVLQPWCFNFTAKVSLVLQPRTLLS